MTTITIDREKAKQAMEMLDVSQALLGRSRHHPKILAAYEALRAALAAQPEPHPCKGIPRSGCSYLAQCDTICNKCGERCRHRLVPHMPIKPTSDRAAIVDTTYHWREIDEDTPRGTKLQLINRRAGVATYGQIFGSDCFWTHWAPLPTFSKETP